MKRKRLRDLYLAGRVTDDEYGADLQELTRSFEAEERAFALRDDWFEDASKMLNLAAEFEWVLEHGAPAAKRQAVLDLRSHLLWDGKNLSISNVKQVDLLINGLENAKRENPAFEPEKVVDTSGRNGLFRVVCPTLCTLLDEVRTRFQPYPQVTTKRRKPHPGELAQRPATCRTPGRLRSNLPE